MYLLLNLLYDFTIISSNWNDNILIEYWREKLNVYELKLKVYLLQDIIQQDALHKIASFIDHVLLKEEALKEFHLKNQYKFYNFCSFYPLAQNGIFKKDQVYTIVIRTIDDKLLNYLNNRLPTHNNKDMKGLTSEIKKIPQRLIEKVYSLTPVLLKDPKGYWRQHLTLEEFEERIRINLIKKYNDFTGSKLDEDFQLYQTMQFINKVPIKFPYKEIHLLGDKLELLAADNDTAQQLIYMSLGTGFGESNARGYGFMNYQYYK